MAPNFPEMCIRDSNIPEEVQNLVSETVLRKHVMIPYAFDKNNANVVHVAMADPMAVSYTHLCEIYNKHINISKLYRKTPKLSNYTGFCSK